MKEGKGNTFSTSLNKSFFYSFPRSFALASMCVVSSLLRKSINRNWLLSKTRKRWANPSSRAIRMDIHLDLMCVCVRVRSIAHANRHTCRRRSTCNKVENDLVNETQDNEWERKNKRECSMRCATTIRCTGCNLDLIINSWVIQCPRQTIAVSKLNTDSRRQKISQSNLYKPWNISLLRKKRDKSSSVSNKAYAPRRTSNSRFDFDLHWHIQFSIIYPHLFLDWTWRMSRVVN